MWNVNFDTKCKMLSPRLQNSLKIFFLTELQHINTRCLKFSIYSKIFNHDVQKLEIQQVLSLQS